MVKVLVRFLFSFGRVLVKVLERFWLRFWYGFGTVLVQFWYGSGTVLVWFWDGFGIIWFSFFWLPYKTYQNHINRFLGNKNHS